MEKIQHIMLADCDPAEIEEVRVGVGHNASLSIHVLHQLSNRFHGGMAMVLRRYLSYFLLPLRVFFKHPECEVLIGWQQFHAINYALYCRLFDKRRDVRIFAFNFTYKRKNGLAGRIYERYMRYALGAPQMLGLHVPSEKAAVDSAEMLGLPVDSMMVTRFGTVDMYGEWKKIGCDYSGFALAIGRSNRDFDFLATVWSRPEIQSTGMRLVIISDTWTPRADLSESPNIVHLDNIKGRLSNGFIAHCEFSIVPIDQANICSGDTVLLNSMMCHKAVVVTAPSTLSEMYVEDGSDGLYMSRDQEQAASVLLRLIKDPAYRGQLGENARRKYMANFSRAIMAESLGRQVGERLNKKA